MIDKIQIESLKSINKMALACKKLNLLTGTNSSGKSSALQGLLLVVQNLENPYGLNGPLVSIGDFRDARNYNVKSESIKISVESGNKTVGIDILEDRASRLTGDKDSELANILNYRNRRVHYLSCNRIGSQDVYLKNISVFEDIGINGQYAIDYLCKHKDDPLEEDMVQYKENYVLLAQVNYWLKYIIGASIKPEEILGTDVVKAGYGMVDGIYSRPKNVGSGVSYLVSIIIACLGSKKGDIIVIENPEIHLHPLSQSKVCEFLYFVAETGRQIFVETHSDHIFNAARVGISSGEMKKEDMTINFFRLGSDNCTRNCVIDIGKNGKIENPIPNLFDQFEVDFNRMLGL